MWQCDRAATYSPSLNYEEKKAYISQFYVLCAALLKLRKEIRHDVSQGATQLISEPPGSGPGMVFAFELLLTALIPV